MDSPSSRFYLPLKADLTLAAALLLLVCAGFDTLFQPTSMFYGLVLAPGVVTGVCILRYWPNNPEGFADFGWANRVTLARGVLVIALVSLAPFLGSLPDGNSLWVFVSLCLIALILDGVDGKVARATHTQTGFGARFDMELDALFILGLCFAVFALERAGIWVLALGLMRYGFVAAGMIWPFINAALPDSFRRKTVCVWQLVTLMVALLPITPDALALWSLVLALALLCYSFGADIRWLYQQHTGISQAGSANSRRTP